jgi:TP901 family phage tail tape measure protein
MVMDVSSLQAAQASMVAFEKTATRSLNTVAQRIRTFGYLSTAVITVPMIAAGKATAKMASDFEFSMQKIVGLAGVAQSSINAFKKEILALAPSIGKGPKELADALYFINSSGLKGAEALDVLKLSAKAAASGLGETQAVANLLTSVLTAYKGTGMTAAYATDILVSAVREGKAEATGFATAIGQIIPIAANMGVSFDQVAGGMAAITLNGASASNAAVYLKGIFQALTIASEKGDAALAKYVSSYVDLRNILKTQGMIGLLKEINRLRDEAESKRKGNGEEFLSDVFPNVRGLTGVLSLAGKNFEYTTALMQRVTNSAGSLGTAFAAVSDTIKMRYDKAIARINVSQISLGTTIANTFIPILESLSRWIEKVTKWYENLSEAQKRHKMIVLAVVAALGPLSLITSSLIYTIGGLTTAIKLAFTVLTSGLIKLAPIINAAIASTSAAMATSLGMAGAIGIVVVAIAGLIYGIVRLIQSRKQLNQENTEAIKIDKIIADSEAEAARKIGNEVAQLNVLKEAIISTNIPTEVRSKLIKELNDRFGTYMKNLLDEKATNEEVKKAIDDVNVSLLERIDLETKLALAGRLGEEKANVMMTQLELIRKRAEKTKEMADLQEQMKVTDGGGKLSKWGGIGLDSSSQLERNYNAAAFAVKGYNDELEVTRKDLLNIEEKIKGIAQLPGIGTVLKDGGSGGGEDTKVISYWQKLQTDIDDATKDLKGFTEAEIKAGKGAADQAKLERASKAQQGILGKIDKGAVKDISDFYATKKQLAENNAKAIYTIEEELATNLARLNIEAKKDLVDSEKDVTKKAKLEAELEGMVIDEINRQKKVAADKLFKAKSEQYELEAEKAKQQAYLEIADTDKKARAIEAIEIDQAQKHIWLMEAIYQKDMTSAQDLLDIRRERNSEEFKDLMDTKARELAEYNDEYIGRKELLEKEWKEGVKTRREYNLALRDLTVEFYDFTKASATENVDFLQKMSTEELNWYIRSLDTKIAMEQDFTEIKKLEEQKRLAESLKRWDAEERRVKSFKEIMIDVMQSLGQQLSEGAETWKEYGQTVIDALKQVIAMIIKEGVAAVVKNALIQSSALPGGPLVAGAVGALAGGLAAGAFSTALNQIPGLANEGAVYGPTILQAGEYPGASSDPEHFIRQSHLESLVESAGGNGYIAETELSGRVVKILLKREERYQNRGR